MFRSAAVATDGPLLWLWYGGAYVPLGPRCGAPLSLEPYVRTTSPDDYDKLRNMYLVG